MYAEFADVGEPGRWIPMEEEVRRLIEETTELGIAAEELFKDTASALFGQTLAPARLAIERVPQCARLRTEIHQRVLATMSRHTLSTDQMRRMAETLQTVAEFARIAEHVRALAEYLITLHGTAETEVLRVSKVAHSLLVGIVRQTYVEVRGGVILSTTRDTALAKRLMAEDVALDGLYQEYKATLEAAVAANPWQAHPLNYLLLVGSEMEHIGNRIVAICKAISFAPPSITWDDSNRPTPS